jgi:hypothetical protein
MNLLGHGLSNGDYGPLSGRAVRPLTIVIEHVQITAAGGLASAGMDDLRPRLKASTLRRSQVLNGEPTGQDGRSEPTPGSERDRIVSSVRKHATMDISVLL